MSSKVHQLKTHSVPYQGVISGRKTFEIRKNDRNFQIGDVIKLREWNGDYTGPTNELLGKLHFTRA